MRRADLAKRLISAASESERRNLLGQNQRLADERLADEIRKACYAAWTVAPANAQRAALAMRTSGESTITAAKSRPFLLGVTGISDITKARFESAVINLDEAAEIFTGIRRLADSAQIQVAKLLALAMLGRYDEAIQTGKRSLKIFVREGDELAAGKIEMNLSNIVSRRSLHREAEKYCKSPRRRFMKSRENAWKAMAENGLANTYAELNNFEKADRYYRMALETARAKKISALPRPRSKRVSAIWHFFAAVMPKLCIFSNCRVKNIPNLDMPHQSAIADLEIADIYSELNLGTEAVEIYERVFTLLSAA